MAYTWLQFKAKVKELLTDASLSDNAGVRAIADYTKAILARDVLGDQAGFQSNMAAYNYQRKRLLGYTITLGTSALQAAVRGLITDATASDDTAYRAIADFVRAQAAKDFSGDIQGYQNSMASFTYQRRRLLGYAVTTGTSTTQAKVREYLTDVTIDDNAGVRAVADYVLAVLAREVDHDQAKFESHMKSYGSQRARLLGYTITLSSGALRTAVNDLIPVDSSRQGVQPLIDAAIAQARAEISGLNTWVNNQILQGTIEISGYNALINNSIAQALLDLGSISTLIDAHIRLGVIDLQSFIDFYKVGHSTVFSVADLVDSGEVSVGTFSEEAEPREAYFVAVGQPYSRHPIHQYSWDNRFDLYTGNSKIFAGQFFMAIDPKAKSFWVFPKVLGGEQVELWWDGKKLDFADSDTVPFDEDAAATVAEYVRMMIARDVDQDMNSFKVMGAGYRSSRTMLYLNAQRKSSLRSVVESSQPGARTASSTCASPSVPDDTEVEIIVMGNLGEPSTITNTAVVASMAKLADPDLIVLDGNVSYTTDYQDNLLKFYDGWIEQELVLLAMGNIDLDNSNGTKLWALFPYLAAKNAGKYYYKVTRGKVNLFILNGNQKSDGSTAIVGDGVGVGSPQETWLTAQVAATNPDEWNIVILPPAPISSDATYTPGVTTWLLDFKTIGVDMVVSAHSKNAERLFYDDVYFLVGGTGGATLGGFGAVPTPSQFRYSAKNGFWKLAGTSKKLEASFINTDGVVVDSITLRK